MNKYFVSLIIILSLPCVLAAQDPTVFDKEEKTRFADYLFNTQQYEFASEEYLKLTHSYPGDPILKKKALQAFRLSHQYQSGLYFAEKFFEPGHPSSMTFYHEIVKLKLLSGRPVLTTGLIPDSIKYSTAYHESLLLDYMMSGQYEQVRQHSEKINDSELYAFTLETPDDRYLSPFLAGTMSAIVPGSGKIYAKRWKDGLSSLLFVGLTAFQSYRGFAKSGTESVYGWIMGGLSFSFYLGNVYGSVKAAKDYNHHLNENYKQRLIDFYTDHY